ncbi:hypothetical protein DFJ73DRAFT_138838 [Zopfochytrium polystomum]|nr:hypothetical protein DFJ73DRAFT_138838 [Zopfochytrium polystomum]
MVNVQSNAPVPVAANPLNGGTTGIAFNTFSPAAPAPLRRAKTATDFPEIYTKPGALSFNAIKEAAAPGYTSAPQAGAYSAFDFYASPPPESELSTPSLNRRNSPPASTESSFGDLSSRRGSELEFGAPASVPSRSMLESQPFERAFSDVIEPPSLSSGLKPPRSMSISVVGGEQRGFNSALFSSDSLLNGGQTRLPSLSINTNLAELTTVNGGGMASAPHDGINGLKVSNVSPTASAASPTVTIASQGPGYRSLADQNPPCNTLYVGNLPLNTSESELRDLFSKCVGFKRLSFRARPNGPICFVEFEDIPCAQLAMNQLHGSLLSNSVKGGIRLSFSKNPLGVRQPSQAPRRELGAFASTSSEFPEPPTSAARAAVTAATAGSAENFSTATDTYP